MWPDNTLDVLCAAGMFTWLTGVCRLTENGTKLLAQWDTEALQSGAR